MNEVVARFLVVLGLVLTVIWAAIALAPFLREQWSRFRKARLLSKVAWLVAIVASTIYGGSKYAGADTGIELAGLSAEYDSTNDVTAVEVSFTAGNVTTNTPVSIRNGETEQWRELEKIGATVTSGPRVTNVLSFAVSGNAATNRYWWVGTETPAVVIVTQGIAITNFVASSMSVDIAWTCEVTNQVFTVQRRHLGDVEWQVAGDAWTNTAFAFAGFTVGESWEWRIEGRAKPYDAEVEYIESPAERGAYFDTGYLVGPDTVIEARFRYNSATPVQQAAFGLHTSASDSPAIGTYINGNGRFAWCASAKIGSGTVYGASSRNADTSVHVFTLDVGAHQLKIDNNTYNYSPAAPVTRRINDAGLCVFSRANWGLSTYSAYGRLYYCKVYEAGEIAADFVPVRKDGEGCLYDRVSGELFHNQGTGAFAVGPDK